MIAVTDYTKEGSGVENKNISETIFQRLRTLENSLLCLCFYGWAIYHYGGGGIRNKGRKQSLDKADGD